MGEEEPLRPAWGALLRAVDEERAAEERTEDERAEDARPVERDEDARGAVAPARFEAGRFAPLRADAGRAAPERAAGLEAEEADFRRELDAMGLPHLLLNLLHEAGQVLGRRLSVIDDEIGMHR